MKGRTIVRRLVDRDPGPDTGRLAVRRGRGRLARPGAPDQSDRRNRLVRIVTNRGRTAQKPTVPDAGPVSIDDPRLSSLRQAAQFMEAVDRRRAARSSTRSAWCLMCRLSWRRSPRGTSGISFPILIDEPAWTLPFLRAFRPARVVRYVRRPSRRLSPRLEADANDGREIPWSKCSRPWLEPGQANPRSRAQCRTPVRHLAHSGSLRRASSCRRPRPRCLPERSRWPRAGFSRWFACRCTSVGAGRRIEFGRPTAIRRRAVAAAGLAFARRVEGCVASVIPTYERAWRRLRFPDDRRDWPYRYSDDRSASRCAVSMRSTT